MHSIKYGLICTPVKTKLSKVIKIANSPVGMNKLAIQLHKQQLYNRKNGLNCLEKAIQELPANLENEQYSIHVENINVNRNIYKELDIYEIYKMEKIYSENIKTNDTETDTNSDMIYPGYETSKTAFGAAIGSIIGISVIFEIYGFFK
jgi:hypothetical protein